MMMTFRAFHPDPKKKLAEHGGELRWFAPIPINNHWTVAMIAAFGRYNFADELIVWLVLTERFAQPFIQEKDTLNADTIRIWPKQVRPFVCPIIGIAGVV